MKNAVEFKNVSFCYEGGDDNVIENVNFYMNYGEISLLSGLSGEGKSTLLYIINGMIPNSIYGKLSGEVLIDGENIFGKSIGELSFKVGSVLQNAEEQIIHPFIKDEIAFGCENIMLEEKQTAQMIDESCKMMQLDKNWKTATLSGGQKQRLITATTLAMSRKILIFDEPLANLDKEGSQLLMSTLKDLSKKGYAILIIEHRIDMVLKWIDKVWNIKDKQVKEVSDKISYLSEQTIKINDSCDNISTNELLFNIENLGFSVKDRVILDDINLSINKGERIVILGENGCGKTTFTKILSRLEKSTSGRISQNIDVKHKNKSKGNSKWFKDVGYIFQNPNYQLFMPTVEQEILFGGESIEYCQQIVDLFELGAILKRHPQSLSEGQKRKVSIASILVEKPKVLILDEPTVGQDYNNLLLIVEILNKIHKETHNTMIIITHDKRCAEALCDKSILIKNHTIEKIGGKELVAEYFNS